MATACVESGIEITIVPKEANPKLYATIAKPIYNSEGDTRVEFNTKKQTVWTEDDQIIVFGPDEFSLWQFDGKTGERTGSFSFVGEDEAYDMFDSSTEYYALYPYNEVKSLGTVGNTPAFVVNFPVVQNYKESSIGLHSNIMQGTSSDGVNYEFENLCGYLELAFTGEKVVKNISISGNNGEIIGGLHYFVCTDIHNLYSYNSEVKNLIIDCDNGVQLKGVPTYFYVTIPPVTLSKGLSITAQFDDGTTYNKSLGESVTIARNTIQPIAAFDTMGDIDWQMITIQHSGNKIVAPWLFGDFTPTGAIYWGDGLDSEINTLDSYVYDDGEEAHTVTIQTLNSTKVLFRSCAGVSEIDLSKF